MPTIWGKNSGKDSLANSLVLASRTRTGKRKRPENDEKMEDFL
jgi:hypothetical protein